MVGTEAEYQKYISLVPTEKFLISIRKVGTHRLFLYRKNLYIGWCQRQKFFSSLVPPADDSQKTFECIWTQVQIAQKDRENFVQFDERKFVKSTCKQVQSMRQ